MVHLTKLTWELGTGKGNVISMNSCVEIHALREESIQTNVILQYKLLAAIVCAVCSVIQQS